MPAVAWSPASTSTSATPTLYGGPSSGPGERHQAALGLGHEVVAGPAGRLALRAEPGDRAVDDRRVARAHALVVHPEPLGPAGPEVLDHHLGAGAQLEGQLAARRIAQVDRHAALAAVHGEEVGGLAARERRAPGARLVAALRALDLDHVGAEVGEHHAGVGPGEHAREVEHAHAAERRVFRELSIARHPDRGRRRRGRARGHRRPRGLRAPGRPQPEPLARAGALADPPGGRPPRADRRLRGRRLRPRARRPGRGAHHHRPGCRQHARRRGRGVGLPPAGAGDRHRRAHERAPAGPVARRPARDHGPGRDVRAGGQGGDAGELGRRARARPSRARRRSRSPRRSGRSTWRCPPTSSTGMPARPPPRRPPLPRPPPVDDGGPRARGRPDRSRRGARCCGWAAARCRPAPGPRWRGWRSGWRRR